MSQHSYEELRGVVVDILLKRERVAYEPTQYPNLVTGVAEVLERRSRPVGQASPHVSPYQTRLGGGDGELVRDVFWDLFRQGFITLGLNDNNDKWPWFRLSYFGQRTIATQSPFRFHDTSSFVGLVKAEVPDISPSAVTYLEEAVAAFYADCSLSCCVMLGVAAEVEFLRLADVAVGNATHGSLFSAVTKQHIIRQKIAKFHDCLRPLIKSLPQQAVEDLETNFLAIQSVLRIARNEAGHAIVETPQREQVYVYMQLFVPFARQLMRLRAALA
ncbi:MAG: hypothetical protein ACLQKA_23240 [Bryobacteraceae bacterium]